MFKLKLSITCLALLSCMLLFPLLQSGCGRKAPEEVTIYCGVDEPYASKVFQDFEAQTGIHVKPEYDIESSKSIGLAGRLEAEKDHPQADVWWSSEPFLSVRLQNAGVLTPYRPSTAADIPDQFKDTDGYWTGTALRARVLAVGTGSALPPFAITSLQDLADPRLKGNVTMARPTSGATVAHLATLYTVWGPEKTIAFLTKLHDNGINLVGGNAVVAEEVGKGSFSLGLTDTDDISDAQSSGGQLTMVVPDQGPQGDGTLALCTSVAMVKGTQHQEAAQKLIDFLVSKQVEQKLIAMNFARWSVRAGGSDSVKAMKVDYKAAAAVASRAEREGLALLEGRKPE
jgi:iron(III) transport system substrate-binding protein